MPKSLKTSPLTSIPGDSSVTWQLDPDGGASRFACIEGNTPLVGTNEIAEWIEAKWKPYTFSDAENARIAAGASPISICTAGLDRLFTGGNNVAFPGCGDAVCCVPSETDAAKLQIPSTWAPTAGRCSDVARELTKVGDRFGLDTFANSTSLSNAGIDATLYTFTVPTVLTGDATQRSVQVTRTFEKNPGRKHCADGALENAFQTACDPGTCAESSNACGCDPCMSDCRRYAPAGFTVDGRRPGYYPDGEDALLWRLPLAGPLGGEG